MIGSRFSMIRHFVILLLSAATTNLSAAEPTGRFKIDPRLQPLPAVAPAPANNPTTPEKVALGKQLFFDPRLSGGNTMSCASCHKPERYFADGIDWNKGEKGVTLVRNTQSCVNVGFYDSYFWDGRAASLEEQALIPIETDVEMNQPLAELERELNAVPGYVEQFQNVFGERPSRATIGKALAAYQRSLVGGPSKYDRFLLGEESALSPAAKRGLALFQGEAGCIKCHNGPLLSDGLFHRMGVSEEDLGRAKWTGREEDRFMFRTPSLRNVAETAPYMHHGLFNSLDRVLGFYYNGKPTESTDGLKLEAPDLLHRPLADTDDLLEFLKALSSEPAEFTPPELPPGAKDAAKTAAAGRP